MDKRSQNDLRGRFLVSEMTPLSVSYCDLALNCTFCGEVTSMAIAEWFTVECDAEFLADYVTISTTEATVMTEMRRETIICDVEVFGS